MFDGFLFSAAMTLGTPLRLLRQHGARAQAAADMQTEDGAGGEWIPALEGQRGFYGTMSSDVGPIPADGGDFLTFLMAVREAVETDGGIHDRITSLRGILRSPEWRKYVGKLGGQQAIVARFFPKFLDTIPGLPQSSKATLWKRSLDTPAKLSAATDERLLAIKGVGKSKLSTIRAACLSAQDQACNRVNRVKR